MNLIASATVGLATFLVLAQCSFSKTTEQLDTEGKYFLTWDIKDATGNVTFEIEAETLGYVGLGISPQGQMTGADIFIGGFNATSGLAFGSDYHGIGNQLPVLDANNDWMVHEARENGTHTYVRVSRLLNTCDDEDYAITESTTRAIWSMGPTDQLGYHTNRGTKSVDIINLPLPDVDIEQLEVWDIIINMTMPTLDTTYWCSFHKRDPLSSPQHIVGFDANLINEGGKAHSHHFIVKKCTPPPSVNASEVYEPLITQAGGICFTETNSSIAASYCSEFLYAWAVGGKIMLFPEDVGFTFGGSDDDLYYMVELHLDNPEVKANVRVETGVHIYYTPELRSKEASLLTVGRATSESILVPPNQSNFIIAGHCSSNCTSSYLPPEGIKIFNIGLHAHNSGRKLKLRHFRNGAELPWPANDEAFDFNFQQGKGLKEEIVILPGDQLTYECVYDSTWNSGKIVIGGLSSRDEMCFAFMWVYGNSTLKVCESLYDPFPFNQTMAAYGITNFTMDFVNGMQTIMIWEPEEMAGMNFTHALSTVFRNWTSEFISERERKGRYDEHYALCGANRNEPDEPHLVKYISVGEEYKPVDPCVEGSGRGGAGAILPSLSALPLVLVLVIPVLQFKLTHFS